ncbi:MAG: deoxyguanosinetriphosphate triphosphohydrolase [Chloroflexi bacterium]|nr:deoxyguanosinetriphosphate triphosphohydrolase [Chloroflexota bacterium]
MPDLNHIRLRIEEAEFRLSPLAAKSRYGRGRREPEEPSPMRGEFQRDRDRIVHCNAFRRLKQKTQVFLAPQGDHYVTRLTHTLIASQIARTIARALNLNEDLAEAITLGHDLGHTPFGHAGAQALNAIHPGGFRHNEQSLRIVEVLEKDGRGLNLTWEVRDGILKHSKARASVAAEAVGVASTLEGQITKLADSIAYINHDIGDAIRAGVLSESDLPRQCTLVLGERDSLRINHMVSDVIESSWEAARAGENSQGQSFGAYQEEQQQTASLAAENKPLITMSAPVLAAVDELRDFLFRRVYSDAASQSETLKAQQVVRMLYEYFTRYPAQLPEEFRRSTRRSSPAQMVCDYVSGMTDRYALQVFEELYVPLRWGELS